MTREVPHDGASSIEMLTMRTAGILFVILGGLALAIQGFGPANVVEQPVSMPAVVSGIVVTSGLLILAFARKIRSNPTGERPKEIHSFLNSSFLIPY